MARALGILLAFLLIPVLATAQTQRPRQKNPNNGLPGEKIPGNPQPGEKPAEETGKEKLKAQPASPDDPPEEDETLKPKVYDFNPLAAEKALKAGEFYFKKANFTAASARFLEAGKYNPTLAQAFLRLGEAYEKNFKPVEALEAYRKYIELAPDSKQAAALKKKIESKPSKKS